MISAGGKPARRIESTAVITLRGRLRFTSVAPDGVTTPPGSSISSAAKKSVTHVAADQRARSYGRTTIASRPNARSQPASSRS